jgi:predicted  nucleic acid-binding Zn-ribbon protein
VKSFNLSKDEDLIGERVNAEGVSVTNLPVYDDVLIARIKEASKPHISSVKDYKFSLRAADSRISELVKREEILQATFSDNEKRLKRDLVDERELKRVREAELDLVLKQYHAVGAMCQEMRQEGKALREMISELRHKYQTSETWASALAGRVADAETELYTMRSSVLYKISSKVKAVKNSIKDVLFS